MAQIEPVIVYMPKIAYDRLSPEIIAEHEAASCCKIIPVDEQEMKRIKDDAMVYIMQPSMPMQPPMPEIPEIVIYDNPHYGKLGGHGTPRIEPKDCRKKKKSKRRAEKQARRKR